MSFRNLSFEKSLSAFPTSKKPDPNPEILWLFDELRRLYFVEESLNQWIEKTNWVQESCQANELGLHRADVLKKRIETLQSCLFQMQEAAKDLAEQLKSK